MVYLDDARFKKLADSQVLKLVKQRFPNADLYEVDIDVETVDSLWREQYADFTSVYDLISISIEEDLEDHTKFRLKRINMSLSELDEGNGINIEGMPPDTTLAMLRTFQFDLTTLLRALARFRQALHEQSP